MNITIIGSTIYIEKMKEHFKVLTTDGNFVRLPVFDDCSLSALEICEHNRGLIQWADEIHMFWDGRSMGTWGDFMMAFALGKPVKVIYLNGKTIVDVVKEYSKGG